MSTLQAANKKHQSVGTRFRGCSTWKMQSCPENTSVAFFCNVRRTAVTSSVQTICWRPLALFVFLGFEAIAAFRSVALSLL